MTRIGTNRNLAVGYAVIEVYETAKLLPQSFRNHETVSFENMRRIKDIKNLCIHIEKHAQVVNA